MDYYMQAVVSSNEFQIVVQAKREHNILGRKKFWKKLKKISLKTLKNRWQRKLLMIVYESCHKLTATNLDNWTYLEKRFLMWIKSLNNV